jgi:hypothetical protein
MTFNPARTDLWPCPEPALTTRLVLELNGQWRQPCEPSFTTDPETRPGAVRASRRWRPQNDTEAAELDIDSGGRLTQVRVNRWGNPDGAPFGRFPFGVRVEAEAEFGGIAIPSVLRAGWWRGTGRQREGDFFRAEITSAVFT